MLGEHWTISQKFCFLKVLKTSLKVFLSGSFDEKLCISHINFNAVTVYFLTVSEGVCGSYNGGQACDTVCGSNYTVTADEDDERSPGKRSQGRWRNALIIVWHPWSILLIIYLCSVKLYQLLLSSRISHLLIISMQFHLDQCGALWQLVRLQEYHLKLKAQSKAGV